MLKVLLWVGTVAGAGILAFGLLALAGAAGLPADQQGDAVAGGIVTAAVGALFFVPSLIFLIRSQRRALTPLSGWSPSQPPAGPPLTMAAIQGGAVHVAPARGFDLGQLYQEWFDWARSEVGGDAIALNAAATAALAAGGGTQAQEVARGAGQGLQAMLPPGARPGKVTRRKVRVLAGVAAAMVPLLEPSEQVLVVVRGVNQAATVGWHLALGWIGQLIAASQQNCYYVVLTDRRVFALTSSQYARRPENLAWAMPRSELKSLTAGWGLYATRRLRIGWQGGSLGIRVARPWRAEAELASRLAQPPPQASPAPPS